MISIGRLIAGDMHLGPVTSPGAQFNTDDALDIQAYSSSTTHTYCSGLGPTTQFDTYNGVKRGIESDHSSAMACSGTPVDDHGGSVSVGFDPNTVRGNPLGAAGVKAVLPLLKFFGPSPEGWTTSPFGDTPGAVTDDQVSRCWTDLWRQGERSSAPGPTRETRELGASIFVPPAGRLQLLVRHLPHHPAS